MSDPSPAPPTSLHSALPAPASSPSPTTPTSTALGQAAKYALKNSEVTKHDCLLVLAKHRNVAVPSWLKNNTPENSRALEKLVQNTDKTPPSLPSHYWNLTIAQLERAYKEHGMRRNGRKLKADLIQGLLETDQQLFPFMSLPPEIRISVYKYALKESMKLTPTSEAPSLVAEPEWMKASKMMRLEALPFFYDINRFSVLLNAPPSDPTGSTSLCADTDKWLRSLEESKLETLSKLNMLRQVAFEIRYRHRLLVLNFDLRGKKTKAHLTVERTCQYHPVGAARCHRWKENKDLERIVEAHNDAEMTEQHRLSTCFLYDVFADGKWDFDSFEELARRAGALLYQLRRSIN